MRGRKPGIPKTGGRKKGARNKRTAVVAEVLATTGSEDPLQERLRKHRELAQAEERAKAALATFGRKHRKELEKARLQWQMTDDQKALIRESDRLHGVLDDINEKLHAIATVTLPYLHAKLASTQASLEIGMSHEDALDSLDHLADDDYEQAFDHSESDG